MYDSLPNPYEEVEDKFADLLKLYTEQSDGKKLKEKAQKLWANAKEFR